MTVSLRLFLPLLITGLLAACGEREPSGDAERPAAAESGEEAPAPDASSDESEEPAAEDAADAAPAAPEGSLQWAVDGDWRGDQAQRDEWRNPAETLDFFGVDPSGTVIEIWPAAGWYTQVLAPWIAANGGSYIAAQPPQDGSEETAEFIEDYREYFSDAGLYGDIEIAAFGPDTGDLAAPGSADAVLTFRNVHNWMARGFEQKAFADFYEALRPGGVLGVVEHRLPASVVQDPRAPTGYVQQDYVIALATEAGFDFVESSEINANPADDADHPFGVWTLPPVGRTAPQGEDPDPEFDAAEFEAIGESDRMTLLFRKPDGPVGAPEPGGGDADDGAEGGEAENGGDEG